MINSNFLRNLEPCEEFKKNYRPPPITGLKKCGSFDITLPERLLSNLAKPQRITQRY